MSAILSADDLNDFISPGVACIKPVETLPRQTPQGNNAYEVVKEGQLAQEHKAAEISLTDCLACSGCVTSAEAVLVSLQSHAEVLNSLDQHGERLYVASVSPQVRASIAATYKVSEREAGWMIDQLLGGPQGLASGGMHGNSFSWIVDTNAMREANLVLGAEEVLGLVSNPNSSIPSTEESDSTSTTKPPILSSACPGWICYAEKTHPHVLPHLSRLKSPQALTGTVLKTVLSRRLALHPSKIWHVAIMPCFDKKLEASREELTDAYWRPACSSGDIEPPVRDVDCVITARELLMLADTRGITFPDLPRQPLESRRPFPDPKLDEYLFPDRCRSLGDFRRHKQPKEAGTSGGYLHHILSTQLALHPGSFLTKSRGRNADVVEYIISSPSFNSTSTSTSTLDEPPLFKAARYYGFRNIQNLVRKLKPEKKSRLPGSRLGTASRPGMASRPGLARPGGSGTDYLYVEVMACPGGCTNGGGQIKVDDMPSQAMPVEGMSQKEWLQKVDESYYSMSDDEAERDQDGEAQMRSGRGEPGSSEELVGDEINGISPSRTKQMLDHWATSTGIPLEKLVMTSYRKVESDVGKIGGADASSERVVESIAGKIGGGW